MDSDKKFQCWACKKELYSFREIAQCVCDNCKASIIRKNMDPISSKDIVKMISYHGNSHTNEDFQKNKRRFWEIGRYFRFHK